MKTIDKCVLNDDDDDDDGSGGNDDAVCCMWLTERKTADIYLLAGSTAGKLDTYVDDRSK